MKFGREIALTSLDRLRQRFPGHLDEALHGARDAALRPRTGAEPGQLHGCARSMARGQHGPGQLLATHVTDNRVDMTRPLCRYPQVAHYTGTGNTNDAANFVCKQ
jgi:hypothetical protein